MNLLEFDQTNGIIRKRGVPNQIGVTEFRSHVEVDQRGGNIPTDPSISNTDLWQSRSLNVNHTFSISVVDGASIRFWIEARDIMNLRTVDSVQVHVDTSPPRIEQMWLQRNGEIELAVHNTNNLRDMR